MAKYKLLSPHFSEEDKLLEAGTEVGEGTPHAWTRPPTVEMEALDDEGRRLLDRERQRAREVGASQTRVAPIDDLPMTMAEVEKKYDEEVKAGEPEPPRPRSPGGQFAAGSPTMADRSRR